MPVTSSTFTPATFTSLTTTLSQPLTNERTNTQIMSADKRLAQISSHLTELPSIPQIADDSVGKYAYIQATYGEGWDKKG